MTVENHLSIFTNSLQIASSLRTKANQEKTLTHEERFLLYEAIFLRMYRAFENFLEDAFIAYMTGSDTVSGQKVLCYAQPKHREHARNIIASTSAVIDWTRPDTVISRSSTYLVNGEPIKTAIESSKSILLMSRRIRNHIAHNSKESEAEFKKVLQHYLTTTPTIIPSPGEFLSLFPRQGPLKRKEVLKFFEEQLTSTALAIAC